MIQANELRIGNLVIYEATTHIVKGIDENGIIASYWIEDNREVDIYRSDISNHSPIQLTEEWLLKFGFERMPTNSEYDYILDVFHLNIDPDLENGYWVDGLGLMKSIQYVHQLQNLYFAITGEELNIKQP